MRENRPHGSEGGGAEFVQPSLPLSVDSFLPLALQHGNMHGHSESSFDSARQITVRTAPSGRHQHRSQVVRARPGCLACCRGFPLERTENAVHTHPKNGRTLGKSTLPRPAATTTAALGLPYGPAHLERNHHSNRRCIRTNSCRQTQANQTQPAAFAAD